MASGSQKPARDRRDDDDEEARERQDKLPEIQPTFFVPEHPGRIKDKQMRKKGPSLLHNMEARKRMFVPGWNAPSSQQTAQPCRSTDRPEPVHLPPLQAHVDAKNQLVQNTVSAPCPPKQLPSSKKSTGLPPSPLSSLSEEKQHFSCAEEVIAANICRPPDLVRVIRNNPHLGFLYMVLAVPKSSIDYNPFNVKIVTYQERTKSTDYFTISPKYVISVSGREHDSVTLERWEQEYQYHCKLLCIPFFAQFRKRKALTMWHTKVRAKKVHECKKSLQEHSFIFNESLRPALMDIKDMCYPISVLGLCHMEKKHTYSLQKFQETQYRQVEMVSARLEEFRDIVKESAICACRTSMLEAGYTLDDHDPKRQQKMTYIYQIYKKKHCGRLTCFLRLVDYLVVNTMHMLMVDSASKLLAVFQEQVGSTPSHAVIQSWGQPEATTATIEEVDKKSTVSDGSSESSPIHPLFISELMLDTSTLTYQPPEETFQDTVAEIFARFQKTVLSVDKLVPDPAFGPFTQPIIYNKVLEMTCGDGPCLESILEDDKHLQSIIQNIKEILRFAFDSANVYSHTFESSQLFYKENERLDQDALQQHDHGVSFFGESLEKYHREHKEALAIQPKRHLGLLLVDTTQLKDKLISSPLRCLKAINEMLPLLAKRKLDAIVDEAQDTQLQLKSVPSSTIDFVNSLTFLDGIPERIKVLEEQQETVCQMYKLINMYSVPEDFAVFATLNPSINSLHNTIDKAMAERDSNVYKFCTCLQKDIKELNSEVKRVKLKAQDHQILDINADSSVVRLLLGEIQLSMDELQAQAFTYTFYQKNFKVDVPKFEALEELSVEVGLKKLLWDSLEKLEWMQSTLDQLDPEQLSAEVNRYTNTISTLEKGLPPNSVVPSLKGKVETMRQKMERGEERR